MNQEITCPICGRVNWLHSHDGWECIGEMAKQLAPVQEALQAARDALRSGLSVIDSPGCDNENCPTRSMSVGDVEREMDEAYSDITDALEGMGVKV